MEHRNYSNSPTCQSCRYWSEMIAQASGSGPVTALCLNSKSEQSGKWVTGASRCEAWVDGPYGAVDQPGGDPYSDAFELDAYVPDYNHSCEVCGQKPVVTGVKDGKVVYQGEMCGVCTWGEADCRDPANW